jgi:hypothetical protein
METKAKRDIMICTEQNEMGIFSFVEHNDGSEDMVFGRYYIIGKKGKRIVIFNIVPISLIRCLSVMFPKLYECNLN